MESHSEQKQRIRTYVCVCPKCGAEKSWQAVDGSEREFMIIEYGETTCKCGEKYRIGRNIDLEKSH